MKRSRIPAILWVSLLALGAGTGCLVVDRPPESASSDLVVSQCPMSNEFVTVDDIDPVATFGANSSAFYDEVTFDPLGNVYVVGFAWINNYSSASTFIRKSEDGGHHWATVATLPGILATTIASDSSGRLYLAAEGATNAAAIYISTDQGQSWNLATSYLDSGMGSGFPALIAPDNEGRVILIGSERAGWPNNYNLALRSTDNGGHWSPISGLDDDQVTGGHANTGMEGFAIDRFGNWFVGTAIGDGASDGTWQTFKSSDHGQTWNLINSIHVTGGSGTNYTGPSSLGIDASGNIISSGQIYDNSGYGHWVVEVSTDDGATWRKTDDLTPVAGGYNSSIPASVATDVWGHIYVAGNLDQGSDGHGGDLSKASVRESTDGGQSWTTIESADLGSPGDSLYINVGLDSRGQAFAVGENNSNGHAYIRALFCR